MTATALIIDDEADIRKLIALTISRMGLEFHTAANLEEARNLINTYHFDLCLTDMKLPDGNGVDFVKYIQSSQPNTPVAVVTAHGNMQAAVEAMKNGAYDFVSKPVDINQLRQLVTHAVALSTKSGPAANDGANEATDEAKNTDTANTHSSALPIPDSDATDIIVELNSAKDSAKNSAGNPANNSGDKVEPPTTSSLAGLSGRLPSMDNDCNQLESNQDAPPGTQLIGQSAPILELKDMIAKVSRTNAPIWITGESGTGKELIARLIHEHGPRGDSAFVAVNCGAIPTNLMESEFFGHKKGSFTGATHDHQGLFTQASGGTLFLDEVAELPLQMQVKLLRAIQERSIRAVGGQQETHVNVRILSASHIDLATEVEAGRFRHDLYYRLNVISLHSPSLRDRQCDIPLLVNHLIKKLQLSTDCEAIHVDDSALERLYEYDFPGNVRELENILERATTMMDDNVIRSDDINLPSRVIVNNQSTTKGHPDLTTTVHTSTTDTKNNDNERQRIVKALNESRWNRKAAAVKLGFTYRQLRYRIQQLGIDNENE